jgi:hypothetical protein
MGFTERLGKGDHTVFSHPLVAKHFAVDGRDGLDAQRYDEKNLLDARRELDEALRREQERDS